MEYFSVSLKQLTPNGAWELSMAELSDNQSQSQSFFNIVAGAMISHYKIIEKIGAGGMGEVYLAEDIELSRQVVLKFLHHQYISDEGFKARFKREAQATASLDHPNIVAVYEVGDFQGRPFIAMQYVEGELLSDLINNDEISLKQSIDLAAQICDGLVKAHQAGITHRDIKPSNVIIDVNGRAKLLDFGLATVKGSEHLTKTGATLGTVSYMSPEQVQGKRVDPRSDLFSFGTVLYEMITGRMPFGQDDMLATIQAIANTVPEPLARFRANVPEELQRIVTKLLQKGPDTRYQHTDDLLADLKSVQRMFDSGIFELPQKSGEHHPSIAVLPFVNLSTDKEQEYFCEGIAEEITNALAHIDELQVAARTSAFRFKDRKEDIREIGQDLNVETVLEGSVRKADNRLRITAQLVDASNGYHLWSEKYDREIEDVFAIQDEISENIARVLRIMLSEDEKRAITKLRTSDVEAYDYYLRGRQYFHMGRQKSLEFARQMFSQAIKVDPDYVLAYAGLADCCSQLVHLFGDSSNATLQQADNTSQKALELDPELAEAHAARGFALWLMNQHDESNREFETAMKLDPKLFEARYFYARACFQRGEHEQALRLFQEACEVRDDHEAWLFVAQTLVALNREEEAITAYRKAIQAIRKHLELNPDDVRAITIGAGASCRVGEQKNALEWADRAIAIEPDDGGVRYNVACVYALGGEKDKAITCLQHAVQAGFAHRDWVENDPDLNSLRDDPHFKNLNWRE